MPNVIQVSPAYRHYDKTVHGHGVIQSTSNRLKWYDIYRNNQPIEQTVRDLALDFVSRQTKSVGIPSAKELGFVLLHRCGKGFYFLGLCTWRGNNELWKTIFYFDAGKTTDFTLFPQDESHRDTFCVWELAVASHETLAWTTYLLSDRTSKDADTYLTAII
ncbi:MAG: hypothetical protein AB8G18_18660 [Gammaproteobacteria bacterium]